MPKKPYKKPVTIVSVDKVTPDFITEKLGWKKTEAEKLIWEALKKLYGKISSRERTIIKSTMFFRDELWHSKVRAERTRFAQLQTKIRQLIKNEKKYLKKIQKDIKDCNECVDNINILNNKCKPHFAESVAGTNIIFLLEELIK